MEMECDGMWLWNRDSEFTKWSSTLQCDQWLWDDMPLNSPKRPPYWNSTSGFHFHTSPQSKRRGGGVRGKGLGRGLCQKKK